MTSSPSRGHPVSPVGTPIEPRRLRLRRVHFPYEMRMNNVQKGTRTGHNRGTIGYVVVNRPQKAFRIEPRSSRLSPVHATLIPFALIRTTLGFHPAMPRTAILHDSFEQFKTIGTLSRSPALIHDFTTLIQIT